MSGEPMIPSRFSDSGGEEYRTLSVLALASCVIGSLCAFLLGLGGLVAITRSSTLFLPPNYMVLGVIPLAGVALGLLAIVRIRNSDGILTGKGLAKAGVALSLMSIIIYGAYHGGMSLALRMRADAFVRRWLEMVATNDDQKVTEAFIYTVPPGSRPSLDQDKNTLRGMIEVDHNNSSDFTNAGAYTTFLTSPTVRLIRQGGKDCTFTLTGYAEPEIIDNGFQLVLFYLVKTPKAEFSMQMQVHGASANIPDIRKWYLKGNRIRQPDGSQNPDWTEEGRKYKARADLAKATFKDFTSEVGAKRNFDKAFLLTFEGTPKPEGEGPALAAWTKKRDDYFHLENPKYPVPPARVIRLEPLDFWSNPDLKNPFMDATDLCFATNTKGPPNPTWLTLFGDTLPVMTERDDVVEMRVDCRLMLFPAFVGQGVALMRAPKATSDQPNSWKLVGIDILSARTMPVPPEMRGAPPEMLDRRLRGN